MRSAIAPRTLPCVSVLSVSDVRDLAGEALRDGQRPRVHPAGFAQLDVPGGRHLHVWCDGLPRQAGNDGVHDHVFDLVSQVVCGQLVQQLFRFEDDPAGSHRLLVARYATKFDAALEDAGVRGRLVRTGARVISPGESYTQPAFSFHVSVPARLPLVTVMTKTAVHPGQPRICVTDGVNVDQAFDRHAFDEAWLWDLIGSAVGGPV